MFILAFKIDCPHISYEYINIYIVYVCNNNKK